MRRAERSTLAVFFMLGVTSQACAEALPDWMIGSWSVSTIFQNRSKDYHPKGGPAVWWRDKTFRVDRDRLTFADWTCEGPHPTLRHGPLSRPILVKTGGTLADLGLTASDAPIGYYDIKCDRSLVWLPPNQSDSGHFADVGISLSWYVVVRSKAEIAMPFQAASFVVFTRATPSS